LGELLTITRRSSWEPFVDKREAARFCGRSPRWVEMRMREDGFPWHPPAPGSNRRRFRLSEISEWLEGR